MESFVNRPKRLDQLVIYRGEEMTRELLVHKRALEIMLGKQVFEITPGKASNLLIKLKSLAEQDEFMRSGLRDTLNDAITSGTMLGMLKAALRYMHSINQLFDTENELHMQIKDHVLEIYHVAARRSISKPHYQIKFLPKVGYV